MILKAKILKKLGACSNAYRDLKNFNLTKTNVAKQARENRVLWMQYRAHSTILLRLIPEKVKFFDMVDAHLCAKGLSYAEYDLAHFFVIIDLLEEESEDFDS